MALSSAMIQAGILYFSDATLLLLFLAGVAWSVDRVATHAFSKVFIDVTHEQLVRLMILQTGIILFALVGFKYVVLTGGPGVAVHTILKTGVFTRVFSAIAMVLATLLCLVGAWQWLKLVRQFVKRRWL